MRLKDQRELIICAGRPPIYARQCVWYQESALNKLPEKITSFVKSQVLNQASFVRRASNKTAEKKDEDNDFETQELKTELSILKNKEKELTGDLEIDL